MDLYLLQKAPYEDSESILAFLFETHKPQFDSLEEVEKNPSVRLFLGMFIPFSSCSPTSFSLYLHVYPRKYSRIRYRVTIHPHSSNTTHTLVDSYTTSKGDILDKSGFINTFLTEDIPFISRSFTDSEIQTIKSVADDI